MKIARFADEKGIIRWGVIEGEVIKETKGIQGPFTLIFSLIFNFLPRRTHEDNMRGENYVDHIEEMDGTQVNCQQSQDFFKSPNALANPEEVIPYPHFTKEFHYEGELAAVISKPMKMVPEDAALEYVLGYTCAFDLTYRDAQRQDLQWVRAKSADKFCPLGPWIETDLDPTDLGIKTEVNGKLVQNSRTSLMIFPLKKILSFTSCFMTLLPGDVILTGTPSGVGELRVGDVVSVTVEGIGTLQITIGCQ